MFSIRGKIDLDLDLIDLTLSIAMVAWWQFIGPKKKFASEKVLWVRIYMSIVLDLACIKIYSILAPIFPQPHGFGESGQSLLGPYCIARLTAPHLVRQPGVHVKENEHSGSIKEDDVLQSKHLKYAGEWGEGQTARPWLARSTYMCGGFFDCATSRSLRT